MTYESREHYCRIQVMMPNKSPGVHDAIVAIDVTDTLVRGLGTGIQRVVRKIAQNAGAFPDVVLVFSDGKDFHKLDADALNALLASRPGGDLGKSPPSASRTVKDFIKSGVIRFPSIHVAIQQRTVGKWFKAETEKWRSASPIQFKPGDKLVLLDTFWNGCGVLPAAVRARSCGAEIFPVVYDTIPITHPDQVPADIVSSFPHEMRKAFKLSSGILATARTSLAAVQQQMEIWRISRPADYFYLGADLPHGFRRRIHSLELSPNFLVVGTIEPRKGHAVILDAFERIWKDGGKAKLTFVGKVGWIGNDLSRRLATLSASNEYFTLNTSATDEMLESLYSDADAVIVASSIEGFGLPIIEALNRGVPVIVSDIPIFREVAGPRGIYFRTGNSDELSRAINGFILKMPTSQEAVPFTWPNWQSASQDFYRAVVRVSAGSAKVNNQEE